MFAATPYATNTQVSIPRAESLSLVLRLIVVGEDLLEEIHDFEQAIVSIGRSVDNHLSLNDLNLSRHHCEIHKNAKGYEVFDKDSRNGTYVNGRRVSRYKLRPGDAVEIGTTTIYFQRRSHESNPAGTQTLAMATRAQPAVKRPDRRQDRARSTARRFAQFDPKKVKDPEQLRDYYSHQITQLKQVLALNKTLSSELVLKIILEGLIDTVVDITGAERGFLLLIDKASSKAKISVSRNIDKESVRDAKDKISRSITREVLETGEPVLVSDAARDPRFTGKESIRSLNLRAVLSVPLKYRDSILGALYIDNRFDTGCFNENVLERVEFIAGQAAIAINHAHLFEENRRQKNELERAQEELLRVNELLRSKIEKQDHDLAEARAALATNDEDLDLEGDYQHIVTSSPAMLAVLGQIDKLRHADRPILIQGESGTGKELIARAIHSNCPRADKPLIAQNCAAIPIHLTESEFFGHVKGAFTHAFEDKPGLFELANGGTLFLDEIGDMDLDLQTKLLRVFTDGKVRRIGAKNFTKVDVKIISASHKDLKALVQAGRFREDLMFRLNTFKIKLPPLRERRSDIPILVQHFRDKAAKRLQRDLPDFSDDALNQLMKFHWPGNIRELENEVERAVFASRNTIEVSDLSPEIRNPTRTEGVLSSLDQLTLEAKSLKAFVAAQTEHLERELVCEALQRTGFRKTQTAKILGISRPTLDAKIDKYQIRKDEVLQRSKKA